MRLSHLIAPGPMAGAENVVIQGCSALLGHGHQLSLLVVREDRCPEFGERFTSEARRRGIPVEVLRVRGRLDPLAVLELRTALRRQEAELVHVHGYKALLYAMAARFDGLPMAVTHHGETSHTRSIRLYEGLARRMYRLADCVFSVSQATTQALVEAGVPGARLRTVPNPVSLPAPSWDSRQQASDGALLFVGRLSEEKGLDVLLHALASERAPRELRLDVAGDGPCADQWQELSSRLGLADRVRWLGMRDDIPALLAEAQALVLPSHREGLPLAVLEAASCEVPVLASRVGGVPEAVWENENAVLLPPGDVEAWARALEDLPRRRTALRDAARRRGAEVRARHAPERWAELTTQHYREISS